MTAACRRSRRGTACRRGRARTGPCAGPSSPVNAPSSWPNISSSSRFSFRAAQFIATNGLAFRGLLVCSARATSSLPVPFSPRISTDARRRGVGLQQLQRPGASSGRCRRRPRTRTSRRVCRRRSRTVRDPLGRLVHHRPQLGEVDRLLQVVRRAELHRLDGGLHVAEPGDDEHLGVRASARGTARRSPARRGRPSAGR